MCLLGHISNSPNSGHILNDAPTKSPLLCIKIMRFTNIQISAYLGFKRIFLLTKFMEILLLYLGRDF